MDSRGKNIDSLRSSGNKDEFAVKLLYSADKDEIKVPVYIHKGLTSVYGKLNKSNSKWMIL